MKSAAATKAVEKKAPNLSRIFQFRELGIIITAIVVFFVVAAIDPRFMKYDNLRSIMLYIPLIVVVAVGEMMVIVTRNIDLSVGSILGFSGIVVGTIFVAHPGFPIWLAFLLGTIVGALLGGFNGLLITKLQLPSIIVTLGTLSIYRGGLFIYGGGRQIDPNHIPVDLIRLSQTSPVAIPWIVIFAIGIAVLAALFIKYSHIGVEMYAIGSNPEAAKLRGINVNMVLMTTFTISGALAGFAGIMYASRFGYINPGMTGVGTEFVVIAAAVIGGVNVAGGSGTVLGVVIGCVLLGVVNTALAVLGVSAFWQEAMYGFIIILALIIDKQIQNRVMQAIKRVRI
jgi:rhamnose transport system permease protein